MTSPLGDAVAVMERWVMDSDPSTPQRSRLTRLPSLRPLASDKLFYFLFHSNPDLILRWLESFLADGNPGLDADTAVDAIEQSP